MENVIRQRIPANVRMLLTDIAPKEEELRDWTEPEPDPVTKDGISLPARAVSENLLNPSGSDAAERTCGLCLSKPSCYTCPRCNVPYCGLVCYRSPAHCLCSEEFYKECVTEELKCWSPTEDEGKTKMQEILLRLRNSADADGRLENVLKDLEEKSGESVMEQDVQALELLSKLAELQSSGKEEESKEIQEILQKLQQIEEGKEEDEDEEDLAEKVSGLNIDALTEEQLWNLLPSQDKEKFELLLTGGGIAGLVELWTPWWEKHEQNAKTLVEEVQSENEKQVDKLEEMEGKRKMGDNTEDELNSEVQTKEEKRDNFSETFPETPHTRTTKLQSQAKQERKKVKKLKMMSSDSSHPPISAKIPPLRTISSSPSPLVQFSVVNTLYGYVFSLCLFNGDISESEQLLDFCRLVLEVSESLGSGRVFSSLSEALDGAALSVSAAGHLDRGDPDAPVRALEAVAHILTGQSKDDPTSYVLSALSQLRSAFSKARTSMSKEEEWRRRFFLAGKKCEFFQSWVNENAKAVKSAARWTWREYSRKRDERETLEKEKKGLEEGQKRGRGRTLIQEI